MSAAAGDLLPPIERAPPVAVRLGRLAALRARLGAGGSGLAVLGVRLGGAVLAYGAQILAARLLGQDGYGIYALALVWLTLLGHIATVGMGQAICRCVATALATGDLPTVRGMIRFGLAFVVGAGLLSCAILWATVALLPGLVGSAYVWPLLLAACAIPLLAAQDALEAFARAFDRPVLGIGPAYLGRHGMTMLALGAAALGGVAHTPETAVVAAIVGLAAGVALQVLLLARHVRRRVPPGPRVYAIRSWLRIALPVALVDGTEVVLMNADVIVLGFFCPPEAVAAYFAASRLAQMLDLARYAASASTAQRFAADWATGRMEALRTLISQATLGAAALAGLGATVLVVLGPFLLGLFGPDFDDALPVLPILSGGIVLSILLGPGEDVLTMLGQERICAVVYAIALAAALGLALVLVPAYGIVGAAIATAASGILRGLGLAAAAYARLGIILPAGLCRMQRDAR